MEMFEDFYGDSEPREIEDLAREFHEEFMQRPDVTVLWHHPQISDGGYEIAFNIDRYAQMPINSKLN